LLYKRAFNDIAEIAEEAGEREPQTTWALVGTVVSFSGGKITVDVESDFTATEGSPVLVKRLAEDDTEFAIARGVVSGISNGSLEVDLRLYLDPSTPAAEDLVFLETTVD
jgi:hypothetical protein